MSANMDIGVVCALKMEAQALKLACNLTRGSFTPWSFYKGAYQGIDIGLIVCGIGKVLASAASQWMIDHGQPRIILNWGCAGGTNPQNQVGEIIAAEYAIEYDYHSHSPRRISSAKSLFDIALSISGICSGIIATADQNGNSPEKRKSLWLNCGASACDWESAAVLRVASANKVSALALRVITDTTPFSPGAEFAAQASTIINKATPTLLNYISLLKTKGFLD
jgi:nucleoside phosphorylase